MKGLSILHIDDEKNQLESLSRFLTKRGHNVFTASSGINGLEIVKNNYIDLVLSDFRMPGMNGLEVLTKTKEINPAIDVVIITAYGNVDEAVAIMKSGAYDYLTKPVDLDELENLIKRVGEKKILLRENDALKSQLQDKFKFESIVTQSGKMENVLNIAGRVASSKATVLIRGESGTGKELVAKAVHFASNRKLKPFITVNVAALSENLLESELFGHVKGSFTGAVNTRMGRFEEADGGTLFIDEIGDIPLNIQVKLLRAIQFGEIQSIGSNETKNVDVRIIAATHRKLEEMIKDSEFREDLFYRLNVVSLVLPSLKERKEDIPLLVDHFIRKYSETNGKELKGMSNDALDSLMKYNFPGNIRELENIIERAVILARENIITIDDLPPQLGFSTPDSQIDPYNLNYDYEEKLKAFETVMIQEALTRSEGNQSAAARILNITERHLRSRLERLGLKNKK
ncbi:MAG: sigma-54-dependent Fis family transcriptional regulator [Melioribacteraceae bacterium]|nr:sigma-54-dependent Fis family transcriptional regulator [Melioribacteraceae bacterium]